MAGKKFLWDGVTYLTRDDARQALEAYKKDGFEVHMFLEEDQYLVYTRSLPGHGRIGISHSGNERMSRPESVKRATPFFLKTGEF